MKGRMIVKHLAINPILTYEQFECQFPNDRIMEMENQEWSLYFDGVVNKKGFGVGLLLVSLNESYTPLASS